MLNIKNLPNELLSKIVNFLDAKTQIAFSHVDKQFRQIVVDNIRICANNHLKMLKNFAADTYPLYEKEIINLRDAQLLPQDRNPNTLIIEHLKEQINLDNALEIFSEKQEEIHSLEDLRQRGYRLFQHLLANQVTFSIVKHFPHMKLVMKNQNLLSMCSLFGPHMFQELVNRYSALNALLKDPPDDSIRQKLLTLIQDGHFGAVFNMLPFISIKSKKEILPSLLLTLNKCRILSPQYIETIIKEARISQKSRLEIFIFETLLQMDLEEELLETVYKEARLIQNDVTKYVICELFFRLQLSDSLLEKCFNIGLQEFLSGTETKNGNELRELALIYKLNNRKRFNFTISEEEKFHLFKITINLNNEPHKTTILKNLCELELTPEERISVLNIAQKLKNENNKADVFIKFCNFKLNLEEQNSVFKTIKELKQESNKASVIYAFCNSQLTQKNKKNVFKIVQNFEEENQKARALASLCKLNPSSEGKIKILKIAEQMKREMNQEHVLIALSQLTLSFQEKEKIFNILKTKTEDIYQIDVLIELAKACKSKEERKSIINFSQHYIKNQHFKERLTRILTTLKLDFEEKKEILFSLKKSRKSKKQHHTKKPFLKARNTT